ncbi:MAG: AraC family transcriptional regulator [Clostridiales bacterium]|nr:AraC family transcriptional regulator [Clostridiales bacterium]
MGKIYGKKLALELYSVKRTKKQCPIIRERGTDYNVFMWIEKGEGFFDIDGDKFTLSEGEGIFIRHDVPCAYWGDELETSWCSFFCIEEYLNYAIDDMKYFTYKMTDYLRAEAEILRNYVNDGEEDFVDTITYETEAPRVMLNGKTTPIALSAIGYSFVSNFFDAVLNKEDDVIIKINAYLEKNYASYVALDAIAEYVGMDKYALCKYYKKMRKITIMDELLNLRVSKAKRMLRYGNDSVEEIGKKCGFESPSYFCKRFKDIVGTSPKQYRKKYF